jgi:hypothetical protein
MLDVRSRCKGVVIALVLLDYRERDPTVAHARENHIYNFNITRTQGQQQWQYV